MSIRNTLLAAALTLASLGTAAQANGLKPIEGRSVNLGDVSGVVYYTIEPDGFRVVTTLAEAEKGTPIRFVSMLAPGQRVLLSTPRQADAVEISRNGDDVSVRKARPPSN
jgi:predicted aconitase